MEATKGPEYCYHKAYLYQTGMDADDARPVGEVQVEILGGKGRMTCLAHGGLVGRGGTRRQGRYPVNLRKTEGPAATIGYLDLDSPGKSSCLWEFRTDGLPEAEGEAATVCYRIQVLDCEEGIPRRGGEEGRLLEGRVALASAVRDNRVVGFQKEAKDRKTNETITERNPLFQTVDPFDPPLPNFIWWRISVQPEMESGVWQAGYCPRQKIYRAMF